MMSPTSIFVDETAPAGPPEASSQRNDATRCLAGLLRLASNATAAAQSAHPDDLLSGVIARPMLRMLLSALRMRDGGLMQHSRRVASLTVGLARKLGWAPEDQKVIEVAGLLHDIGKIGIPDNVLFKPGRLNPDDLKLMNRHHSMGLTVLQSCRADLRVVEYTAGGGGTEGDASSDHQGAKILAVADAYDSLSHDQVFQEGKRHEDIIDGMLRDSAQFDGNVVSTLARWVEDEGLPAMSTSETDNPPPAPAGSPEAAEAAFISEIFTQLFSLESTCDGFFVLDADLRFVVWSPGAAQLLHRPAREVLGQVWSPQLLGYRGELGQALAEDELPLQQAITTSRQHEGTVSLQRGDSQTANIDVRSIPVLDQSGHVLGLAEMFTNRQQTIAAQSDHRDQTLAASRDALTGVANRSELENQLLMLLDDWRDADEAEPFSVIAVEVDFFDNISNTFGHTAADQVLIDVARLLQQESMSGELIARGGGEKFVILCPSTPVEQAARRSERLRASVAETKVGGTGNYRISASFGTTQVERSDSPDSVLERADTALRQATQSGRNRTCSLTSEQAETAADGSPEAIDSGDPFVLTSTFQACLAADMIVYKLSGFVRDEKADVKDVTPTSAEFQLGSCGLFRRWGSSPKKQPVLISIDFGTRESVGGSKRASAPHVEIKLRIEPVGSARDPDVFQSRAKSVLKLIRSYFAAE